MQSTIRKGRGPERVMSRDGRGHKRRHPARPGRRQTTERPRARVQSNHRGG